MAVQKSQILMELDTTKDNLNTKYRLAPPLIELQTAWDTIQNKMSHLPTKLFEHNYVKTSTIVKGFLILLESKISVPDMTPEPFFYLQWWLCNGLHPFSHDLVVAIFGIHLQFKFWIAVTQSILQVLTWNLKFEVLHTYSWFICTIQCTPHAWNTTLGHGIVDTNIILSQFEETKSLKYVSRCPIQDGLILTWHLADVLLVQDLLLKCPNLAP